MAAGGAAALPAVHDTGDGPAVLFLHAFPLDSSQWDHQVAALSGEFRCVRVDVWGAGGSPASTAEPGLAVFAAAVLQGLDERGVDRFAACGCSMGGYVAWELMRLAAPRVSALVLCSTRAVADTHAAMQNREQTALRVLSEGVESIVEENVQRLLSARARDEAHIADPVRGRIRRCTPDGIAWALRAMAARPDSSELLASIRVPTLVIAGAEDVVIPSDDQRSMAGAVGGAEFTALEGCGHLPNLEEPAQFNKTLRAFLS